MEATKRLESLDALRGFDMLFIMGGASLVVAICSAFGASDCWLAKQMVHVPWHGLAHHDTIFPLFLFIAGVTFPFSFAKQIEKGASTWRVLGRIAYRAAMLALLGLVCNGLLNFKFDHLRVWSVLGRIGLAWAGAAVLYVALKNWIKTRIGMAVVILVGYALLARFGGAPDHPDADPFSMEGCFVCWLDRVLLPNHIYKPLYDPEGLLGIVPAVVTAMLGMFAGEFIRREDVSGERKTVLLLVGAVGLGLAAWGMSFLMPVNKALWSSSFVLAVGSYSAVMLAAFYWIIDVKGWRRWAFFFKVIGMNSITIYMAKLIIPFGSVNDFFFRGVRTLLPDSLSKIALHLGYIAVCWLFLLFLYRKKIFLKV
ncbi:MAG: DUF5009 domain-containing protein [bacterium]|nr:DUF5009 domain-containing protein [bacterium]